MSILERWVQNPLSPVPLDLIQENYWDEQNQLRGLWNLAGLHHYIYDADGQRLMKSSAPMSHGAVVMDGIEPSVINHILV